MSRAAYAVALGSTLLFFWWLGGNDLWAPDEPYFAEGAREMLVDGMWAVPHVNGVVTTDKPPLFFWLIALFSLPTGSVTPFTARLPSALAALGTVLLVIRLGGRFLSPRAAPLAGAALATTYLFWAQARSSQIDALLCFLIWTALSAFEAFRAGDATGRRAGLLFWFAAALAVLAKGPVGVLLPVGIAVTTLALDRDLGSWRRFAPVWGPALFAALVAGWMLLATLEGQGEYSVWGAFREHVIERAVSGLHHKQPFWYYLQVLPASLLPWTGLLPGALVLAWRRRQAHDRLLLAAALFVIVFFSIPTEKRGLYVLPALPAFALMIAGLLESVCRWTGPAAGRQIFMHPRWVTVGQALTGGVEALLGAALPFVAGRWARIPPEALYAMATVLLCTGAATLWLAWWRRLLGATLAPAAGFGVACLVTIMMVYPALEPMKSARAFSIRMKELTAGSRAAGLPVVAYSLGNLPEAFAFYTNGVYTNRTNSRQDIVSHLQRKEPVFALIDGRMIDRLPRDLVRRLRVVDATRLSHQDVLLVTNAPYSGAPPLDSYPGAGGE